MPGEPSAWAVTESRHLYLHGRCACDLAGTCALHLDIAHALDAAELRGRQRAVKETAGHCYRLGYYNGWHAPKDADYNDDIAAASEPE